LAEFVNKKNMHSAYSLKENASRKHTRIQKLLLATLSIKNSREQCEETFAIDKGNIHAQKFPQSSRNYAVDAFVRSFIHSSMALQPSVGPWPLFFFFSFVILYTVGRTPRTGDQPVARPLYAHRTTQTQNKRTQIRIFGVGLESMTPEFKRLKTVYILDRVVTVIGHRRVHRHFFFSVPKTGFYS
jgi:hypothetical protein